MCSQMYTLSLTTTSTTQTWLPNSKWKCVTKSPPFPPQSRFTQHSNFTTHFLSPPPLLPYPKFSHPHTISGATAGDIFRDAGATALVLGGAYGLVSAFDYLSQRDIITQNLSRKLVHVLSGLIFLASWPLFSTATEARYFASFVPLTNCLRLVVHGLSLATNEGLIKSLTREGKPEELLRGPLFYVLVLVFSAVAFWRESPVGVIALAMMCGGDGVADIMGRKFGHAKIPYNQNKSWAGSISMFAFGFIVSLGMLYYFSALGYFQLDWLSTAQRVAVVSFIATVVESLPVTQLIDDNISVPVAASFTAYVCFCL